MKKLVLSFVDGEKAYASELWNSSTDDEIVFNTLKDIEENGNLTFANLEKIYKRFNEIAEVDSDFVLDSESKECVVVTWPDEAWTVKFYLE